MGLSDNLVVMASVIMSDVYSSNLSSMSLSNKYTLILYFQIIYLFFQKRCLHYLIEKSDTVNDIHVTSLTLRHKSD